jgi:hypothetical protein
MASRIRFFALLVLAGTIFCGACGKTPVERAGAGQAGAARPTIVFMTDFGTANDAVAVCKAVIVGIAPDVRLMDITHQVTPFQIEEAARFLAGVTPYYPSGTIFLVVVDPGVGTSRKAVIVKTKKGQYFVLPDNGVITPVIERDGLDSAREITNGCCSRKFLRRSMDGIFFHRRQHIWLRGGTSHWRGKSFHSWCSSHRRCRALRRAGSMATLLVWMILTDR